MKRGRGQRWREYNLRGKRMANQNQQTSGDQRRRCKPKSEGKNKEDEEPGRKRRGKRFIKPKPYTDDTFLPYRLEKSIGV